MTDIRPMTLENGSIIYIEVQDTDVEPLVREASSKSAADLPDDVELTGTAERLSDAARMLRETLQGIVGSLNEAIQEHQPDEWGVELNIGFKGKADFIPVILSSEANAALKVHAKWKK